MEKVGFEKLSVSKLQQERVAIQDKAYEERFRSGLEYDVPTFMSMVAKDPELKKKSVIQDKLLRDGSTQQVVKVYDHGANVRRFEKGDEAAVIHSRDVDNGMLTLTPEQQRN